MATFVLNQYFMFCLKFMKLVMFVWQFAIQFQFCYFGLLQVSFLRFMLTNTNIYLFKEGFNLPERYWECKLFFDIDRQERYICPAIDI